MGQNIDTLWPTDVIKPLDVLEVTGEVHCDVF